MTKIKVDIESDETIISAKILLRHLNGQTTIEDIQTEEESMNDKMIRGTSVKQTRPADVDDAFKQTY